MTLYEKLVQVKREHPEFAETMNEAIEAVRYPFRHFCMQEARYCLEEQMGYPDPEEETVRIIAEELGNSDYFASNESSMHITRNCIQDVFNEIRLFVPETYTNLIFLSEDDRADEAKERLYELYADMKNKDSSDKWKERFLAAVEDSDIPAIYEDEENTLLEEENAVSGRIADVVEFFVGLVGNYRPEVRELTKEALKEFVDFDVQNIKGGGTVHVKFYPPQPETDFVVFSCFRDGGKKTLKFIQEDMREWDLYEMIEDVIAEEIGDPDAIIKACKCPM